MLPFRSSSFDFITCQFGFHHLRDKAGMLHPVFNVLRFNGRFVIRNVCPHEHPDWLYYDYFPEALQIDLADFWSPETVVATMEVVGFASVAVELEHLRFEQDLRTWLVLLCHFSPATPYWGDGSGRSKTVAERRRAVGGLSRCDCRSAGACAPGG
ncbi:MAG: methyltransferase domain-containing protein, partial [Alphaproteobacteria bacterium]|nr:methyltransferase domain-containing protein [Alphaproteobacteria bacterium]